MPKEFDPAVTAYIREKLPAVLSPLKSVKEQADAIGVSDAQLSNVLRGEARVGKGTLPRFAKALGVTVEQLISDARSHFETVRLAGPGSTDESDETIDEAIDQLVRAGYSWRRAEHAAKWVDREPGRGNGAKRTTERIFSLARALLAAEDDLIKKRRSGPSGPVTRHKLRRPAPK